jgi:uncharacterized protein YigE (DUF2233 family)
MGNIHLALSSSHPITFSPTFILMLQYLFSGFVIFSFLNCNNLSPETKKQIEKSGREVVKQVKATVDHIDLVHDYTGFEAKPGSSDIRMYWKDDKGTILGSLQNLKNYTVQKGDSLLYACNGGMYMENQAPLGYYIENGKTLQKINTRNGYGNFYMKPKGVFYVLANGKAGVQSIETPKDRNSLPAAGISYLTQSGPMLISNGIINTQFTAGSANLNVRNGVGILPNGNAYFAMSTYPVNLYDFAKHFKDKGCKNALFFDGFVSRTYCPQENYTQLDGAFGVMIAVVKK